MVLSHNQRKYLTATVSEDLTSATTYINTPMRQRTHRHREMEGLPYRVLDGIRAPTTPLNLQCLKRLDSYLCRGPEPPLCSRPWAHQYLAYTVVGVFVFCLHKMTNRPSWWKEAGLSLWALISLFVWCTQVSHPGWCALLQKLVHLRKRFFLKKIHYAHQLQILLLPLGSPVPIDVRQDRGHLLSLCFLATGLLDSWDKTCVFLSFFPLTCLPHFICKSTQRYPLVVCGKNKPNKKTHTKQMKKNPKQTKITQANLCKL